MNLLRQMRRVEHPGLLVLGLLTLLLTLVVPFVHSEEQTFFFFDVFALSDWTPKVLLVLALLMAVLLVLASALPGAARTTGLRVGAVLSAIWLTMVLYYLNDIPLPGGAKPMINNLDRAWIASLYLLGFGAMWRSRNFESKAPKWFAGLSALFIVLYFLMEIEGVERTRLRLYLELVFEGGVRTFIGLYFLSLFVVALGAVLAYTQDELSGWFRFVSRCCRWFIPVLFALYFFVFVPPGTQLAGGGTLGVLLCAGLYFAVAAELFVAGALTLTRQD
jgi:hypothetical protein